MEYTDVLTGKNIKKSFGKFTLDVAELHIPKGYATALIGENGAGKTTLLNILSGIRLDAEGDLIYFDKYDGVESSPEVKEAIGYTGPGNYYLPHWSTKQVREITSLLFDRYDDNKFLALADELALDMEGSASMPKKVHQLSDGNQMKLMLCGALARETSFLILDEPASPLDPLMRDKLCDLIRNYIDEGAGEKSVLFSTHNVADMENVTDYAMIMEQGRIVEQGFITELKERYIMVHADAETNDKISALLLSPTKSQFGISGIIRSEDLDKLAGISVETEEASLTEIVVAIMKSYSKLSFD